MYGYSKEEAIGKPSHSPLSPRMLKSGIAYAMDRRRKMTFYLIIAASGGAAGRSVAARCVPLADIRANDVALGVVPFAVSQHDDAILRAARVVRLVRAPGEIDERLVAR